MTAATIYRCATCGRWSHAKRRPRQHRRWLAGAEALAWTGPILTDHRDGQVEQTAVDQIRTYPPAIEIICGPFEEWLAIRRDHDGREAA